jgi:hypothetical protein
MVVLQIKPDISGFICRRNTWIDTMPQPYGCISEIVQDQYLLHVKRVGYLPVQLEDVSNR